MHRSSKEDRGIYIGNREINIILEKFISEIEAPYIFKDEYVFEVSKSPENTREENLSTSEVSIASNPVYQMRSVGDNRPLQIPYYCAKGTFPAVQ